VQFQHATFDERANQVLGHAGQSEATKHDGRAIGDVGDRFVTGSNDFVQSWILEKR